jgi:hypothetical protein
MCGDEGGGTATDSVTAFQSGQTITVTINGLIFHPGHYRIALAISESVLSSIRASAFAVGRALDDRRPVEEFVAGRQQLFPLGRTHDVAVGKEREIGAVEFFRLDERAIGQPERRISWQLGYASVCACACVYSCG